MHGPRRYERYPTRQHNPGTQSYISLPLIHLYHVAAVFQHWGSRHGAAAGHNSDRFSFGRRRDQHRHRGRHRRRVRWAALLLAAAALLLYRREVRACFVRGAAPTPQGPPASPEAHEIPVGLAPAREM